MSERKQYFLYGIMLTWEEYLEMRKPNTTVADVLKGDENVDGIFGGRDGEFMIIGVNLGTVEDSDKKPYRVPQLEVAEESLTRVTIEEKYGIIGEFHYYFVKK